MLLLFGQTRCQLLSDFEEWKSEVYRLCRKLTNKYYQQLDEVILLPIYPARELPIDGVTSELILNDVTSIHKELSSKENLLTLLDEKELDVIVTFGAGDIDKLVPEIKNYLKKRFS